MIKKELEHIQDSLSSIWKELLGLDDLLHEQNFFALGGHSLLAIDLLTEIEEVFHVKLNMKDIVESPSIIELSRVIVSSKNKYGDLMRFTPNL